MRLSLVSFVPALFVATPVFAGDSGVLLGTDPDPPSKKDQYLAGKTIVSVDETSASDEDPVLDGKLGQPPPPIINIYNQWTHETLVVDAEKDAATVPYKTSRRFLRCRFTNQIAEDLDPRLFDLVVRAARKFKSDRIRIVSAYRSPKYNLMLRKKGRNVARNSQHVLGNAVDFKLAGVGTGRLYRWVRAQRLGGVGFYPGSGFVHADTGPIRTWRGR